MNERTDHAAKARLLLSRSAQFNEPDAAEISADLAGLTHGVLALVEQQRIQNLIALCGSEVEVHMLGQSVSYQALGKAEKVGKPENGFIRWHLNPDIAAALGLEGAQS